MCVVVDVTAEERDVLLAWKKRGDSFVLVRLKAEAILYASRGVGTGVVAEMVGRSRRTVSSWLRRWRCSRLHSVVTGHAGNENAAKLTRAHKEQLKQILSGPPARSGIRADFWDVPALRDVVRIKFGVGGVRLRLLLPAAPALRGDGLQAARPFDKRRDEAAITERMDQVRQEVADLLARGWEVYTVDEVRVEHEAVTRRMWLPTGRRTKIYVDRERSAQSFFGALSLTSKQVRVYPIEGNQNAEQVTLALARLVRETANDKIAVVLDNAGFHHAKAVTDLYEPGQALERVRPIYLPPYAPDHNPIEHVWNTAKKNISNIQRDNPEETYTAFTSYITSRTFDYDFEHLPITPTQEKLD